MNKCALCRQKDANKTNSHIVPHFLIESMVNADGIKGRGREISNGIGSGFPTPYFGESILPERIEESIGRKLEEHEIEWLEASQLNENRNNPQYQQHQFAEDYIFCNICEEKFSTIESYYKEHKLSPDRKTRKIDVDLSLLFWISVIWRVSIWDKQLFKLKGKEEKKLHNILVQCLDKDRNTMIQKTRDNRHLFSDFVYILLQVKKKDHSNVEEDSSLGTVFYAHAKHQMPYSFIINDHILFFYMKKGHIGQCQQTYFGFEKLIDQSKTNKSGDTSEKIIPIEKNEFENRMQQYTEFHTPDLIFPLYKLLANLHTKHLGKPCPPEIIKKTIAEYYQHPNHPIIPQEQEELLKSIFIENIKQYAKYYLI